MSHSMCAQDSLSYAMLDGWTGSSLEFALPDRVLPYSIEKHTFLGADNRTSCSI
jgi:hypothetical protein